jgi:hypothetical protein
MDFLLHGRGVRYALFIIIVKELRPAGYTEGGLVFSSRGTVRSFDFSLFSEMPFFLSSSFSVILSLKKAKAEHAMTYEPIVIIAYAGYRGEESPRAFILGGKCIEVRKILAQWVEEDVVSKRRFRCFRVEGDDLGNHLLRYAEATGDWLYWGENTDG